MLTVTESAGAHLSTLLNEADAPEDVAVRFILDGQNLAMALDNEQPEDKTFDHEGKTILLLDNQISELLADKTLDIQIADDGPQLALS